jgi:hypothetical protein
MLPAGRTQFRGGRREVELLLACARVTIAAPTRQRVIELLRGELDWAYVVALAQRHGLRPLLFRHLDAIAPAAAPGPIFARLWAWHERTATRNAVMAQELLRILQLFADHGIPALPYKGPALAASLYGSLALREFSDLDILLRPEDVRGAKNLLLARGYRPEFDLQPAAEAAMLRSGAQYHFALVHAGNGLMVELHWATDLDFPVEAAAAQPWWEVAPSAELEQGRVRAFTPDELVLILCLHGSKHYWSSLGWLVDVAQLIDRHPDIDWEWIVSTATTLACERRLGLGLKLAADLLDVSLPERMRHWIADIRGLDAVAAAVTRTLFEAEPKAMRPLETLKLDLALYGGARLRLRHVLRVVFAPSLVEWSLAPLPAPLMFLHYPLRVVRLAWKAATGWLGRQGA